MKELLRESAFDPRGDGPSKIIAETSESNPRYAEDRARELIAQAQQSFAAPATSPLAQAEHLEDYHRYMTQAIGLLALARALRS